MRRNPRRVLEDLAAWLPSDLPADGPDGPTAILERRLATSLGKEQAVFFPTGKMAQQVALRLHADSRGIRTFAGHPATHVAVWEQQGYAVVPHLAFDAVGEPNRLMTLEDLQTIAESPPRSPGSFRNATSAAMPQLG